MDKSSVAYLIGVTYTTDSIGQYIPQETRRMVYCAVRSITRNEWFEAAQNNMKPQYEVSMFRFDYNNEPIVEYENNRYGVYRTYMGKDDIISLYLEDKASL